MPSIQDLAARISINTHSSIRLEAEHLVIYFDPFGIPEEHRDADLIFLTHDHYDHYSPESIDRILCPRTCFVAPASTAKAVEQAYPGHRVITVQPDQTGEVLGLPFRAVRAYNPGKPFHPRANDWVGYVVTAEGLRVYVAGDTDHTPETDLVRCDIALVPIGGKYTMDPGEAASLINTIRPALAIPTHYGTVVGEPGFYHRFAGLVGPSIRVEARL